MTDETFQVRAADGHPIPTRYWASQGPARGSVQVLHGLAEHSARYRRLAVALNAAGFNVVAHDHRGHGEAIAAGTQGYFADEAGWSRVVDDVFAVRDALGERSGDRPVVLLGHSMGSYIAQAAMLRDPAPWSALVLSGSNFAPRLLLRLANWVARFERWRIGSETPSRTMGTLSFGSYNKPFAPNRTDYDWLSRDPDEVDKYVADPWCGFDASTGLWVDLTGGLLAITSIQTLTALPHELPVYVVGGAEDPISAGGRLEILTQSLDAAGVENVLLRVYDGARHEVFNETNRDDVTRELIDWMCALDALRTEHAA